MEACNITMIGGAGGIYVQMQLDALRLCFVWGVFQISKEENNLDVIECLQ